MPNLVFNKSIFANYFEANDSEALAWAENVLEKLKAVGLVPEYIQREDESLGETDFENYYRPVAIFFAYLVKLARTFGAFKENVFLANEFLNQHGQFTSGNETLDQLAYAIENSLRIRAQRGGVKMVELSIDDNIPDGELLRMIGWDVDTFFKLGVARPEKNSWNIDNSSPTYRGNTGRYDLNIGYEYTEDVLDLSAYPIVGETVSIETYLGKQAMKIQNLDLVLPAGIGTDGGAIDSSSDEHDKLIVVDPRINFEMTLYVAQNVNVENITIGCAAFDIDGNPVDLIDAVSGTARNFFFETRRLNQDDKFYFIRGILFNKDKNLMSVDSAQLDIGFGRHLIMPENVRYIIPLVFSDNNFDDDVDSSEDNFDSTVDSDADSNDGDDPVIYLWNIKVTPASTEYSRCYLDNKNFIDIYIDNKSGKYTNDEIEVFLRKYFIPIDTAFNEVFLDESFESESNFVLLEDGDYFLLEDEGRIELE